MIHAQDLYIAMECMDSDLSHVIRNTDDMSEHQMKYIIYHILKGVNELHARGLVHRDLKPQNILVDRCNEPYISDFGLATPVHHREDEGIPIGERVGTPGYMAPELFVSHSSLTYSKPVDIWAVGCIFADLLGGTVNSPLFYSKSSYQLVNNILDVVGFPSEGDVRQMGCDLDRGDTPEDSSSTANTIEGLRWRFPDASDDALDFLRLCLQFNPAKRPAAGELMNHKFFADFHFAEPEEAKGLIDIPCMRCPVYLSTEQYRRKILNAFNVPLPEALTIPVSMKELETSILSDIEVPADIYSTGLADNVREYQCGKSSCCDSLREFFPSASAQGLDFLRLCLKFNLPGGSTAEDLLRHPFLTLKDAPCDNKVVNAANDAVDAGNKPDLWTLPGDDSTKEEEISAEYLEDAIIKLIDADDESQGVAESPKLEDPAVVVPRRGSQVSTMVTLTNNVPIRVKGRKLLRYKEKTRIWRRNQRFNRKSFRRAYGQKKVVANAATINLHTYNYIRTELVCVKHIFTRDSVRASIAAVSPSWN